MFFHCKSAYFTYFKDFLTKHLHLLWGRGILFHHSIFQYMLKQKSKYFNTFILMLIQLHIIYNYQNCWEKG